MWDIRKEVHEIARLVVLYTTPSFMYFNLLCLQISSPIQGTVLASLNGYQAYTYAYPRRQRLQGVLFYLSQQTVSSQHAGRLDLKTSQYYDHEVRSLAGREACWSVTPEGFGNQFHESALECPWPAKA